MIEETNVNTPREEVGDRPTEIGENGEEGMNRNAILKYLIRNRNVVGPEVMRRNRGRKKKKRNQKRRRMVQLQIDMTQKLEESVPYGKELYKDGKKGIVIFFQNVNGIWKEGGDDIKDSLERLDEVGAKYIGLTESLINERHEKAHKVKGRIARHMEGNITITSNPEFDGESGFQPGGIITIVKSPLEEINKESKDPTGNIRVTETMYKGKPLAIITMYRPNKAEGPMRVYTQAINQIRRKKLMQEPIDVTKYLYDELERRVENFRNKGGSVIIGGDFNEEDTPSSTMTKRMKDMGMENVVARYGGETPATFKGGKKTIDHIWITSDMGEYIEGAGYCRFDEIFNSDHRGSFIRIQGEDNLEVMGKREGRILKSKNEKVVEGYIKSLRELLEAHNVFERTKRLNVKRVLDNAGEEELQALDKIVTQCMLKAEEKQYTKRTGDHYTETMHNLKKLKRYWKAIRNRHKRLPDRAKLMVLNPEHVDLNIYSHKRCVNKIMTSIGKEMETLRQKGADNREKDLEEKIGQMGKKNEDGETRDKAIKQILLQERSQNMWGRIRKATGRGKKKIGISVSTPEGCDSIKEMWEKLKIERRDPEDMNWSQETNTQNVEDLLLEWCTYHFSQTNDTPLGTNKWRAWMDPRNPGNKIEEILKGARFMDGEEKLAIRELIEAMKKPEGWRASKASLEYEHFREFCQKQEERKTSSPSGRHYGHVKSCLEDEEILRVLFDILNLSYTNNKPLNRWKEANDILLRKDSSKDRIHRFRNITIIEGDLQYIMKTVWGKNLIDVTTEVQSTAQNCRRGRVAQSSVLGHRLAMDTIRIQGGEAVIIENDAVNCFDRILVELGAVASMRMGLPEGAAKFMVKVLKEMKHHIAMGDYVSQKFVESGGDKIFDGTGQGTGWAPAIWQVVFDIVLQAMEKFQPGIILVSPDGKITDKRTVEGMSMTPDS